MGAVQKSSSYDTPLENTAFIWTFTEYIWDFFIELKSNILSSIRKCKIIVRKWNRTNMKSY